MMKKFLRLLAMLLLMGNFGLSSALAGGAKAPPSGKSFSREDYMVMNLNRGNDSTGAHISAALKEARIMVKELDKSLRQLQQVDREFAKSKGKPDDRFLVSATERLEQALKSARELANDLEASREELKDNIHQALLMSQ